LEHRSNSSTGIDPAELARLEGSLYEYVKASWHVFDPGHAFVDGWHIGCVCEHLQAVSELQINNLIINIPPRHGKSMASGVGWFTWGWAKQPYLRWMYNSYADSLVIRDAEKSRDVINSGWYQRRWGHRYTWGRQAAVTWYNNSAGGYRMSTTVGGKATGHGADILVADDPLKALDARSAAERMRVINWWTGTMSTRINDPSMVRKVIIMQRLHEADLAGFLAARGNYEMLVLPAEYEPKRFYFIRPSPVPRDAIIATKLQRERPELLDPRKDEGELLWPARFGRKELDDLKLELEAPDVAGQLQQRPSPADGTVFQRSHFLYAVEADTAIGRTYLLADKSGREIKRVQVARCRFFQTVDTAQKVKKTNDPTAVGTFAVTPDGELIIIHMVAERIEIPYQLAFLKAMRRGPAVWSKADHRIIAPAVSWPRPLLGQWVEDASSGTMLLASGLAEGIVFRTLKASHDKIQRAAPLSALYEAGRVYHLRGGAWLVGYEDEAATFPAGAHDDRVDVAAYAAQVALYDAIIRAGMAGLEEIAAQYNEPDPDDPGAVRRPWLLEAHEVLDELPDPVISVMVGEEEVDSPDDGFGSGAALPDVNPALPPPVPVPGGDWPDVLEPPSPAARAAARLMAPPPGAADPLSLD
jgi:predicted phage terminase large subunit-like protein